MVDKKQNTQYEESRTDITQPRVTPLSPNRLDNHHTALKGSHCPPVYLTFEQFCTNILFMLLLNTMKNLHISNQLYKQNTIVRLNTRNQVKIINLNKKIKTEPAMYKLNSFQTPLFIAGNHSLHKVYREYLVQNQNSYYIKYMA